MLRWVAILAAVAAAAGCDRNVEPFDPNEEPAEPDLARIFPAGAEQAQPDAPGLPPPPDRGAPPLAASAGADAPPITGTISVAEALRDRVRDDAVLFLIARRDGAGPPLAVVRVASPRFPLEFSIGPEDRMIQALPFAGEMRITARLDGDANATSRQPGDLEGSAERAVAPGASGVAVVLDRVLEEPGPGSSAEPAGAPVELGPGERSAGPRQQGRAAAAQRGAAERSAGPRQQGREAAAQRGAAERSAGPRQAGPQG